MSGTPKNHFFLAFLLIFFGLLMLLNNLGVASFNLTFGTWWPLLLVIIGLHQLVSSRFTNLFALILLFVGGSLQLRKLGLIDGIHLRLFWPLLLILFGVILLFNFGGASRRLAETKPNSTCDEVVVFGNIERRIASPSFRGGNVTALFGGVTLDLRGSEMSAGTNTLNIQAVFGGVDLILPAGWTIEVRGVPIFGGIEDQRKKEVGTEGVDEPKLRIDALVIFGGIDIKD
ncbi:MAG: cell wall-active antibiotics response protein [Firmicutes bacterium]|nr:cell wall-active antibiotics response protein [Bacillota bacterium]